VTRVLIVDDEAPMRAALEAHFARDGWDVASAYGANDAVIKFRQSPCSLVVTDMRMPDGDGLGVLRGLREIAPSVGVIFLTAYGSVPDAVRAMREGACDYFVKPVCFEHLKSAAERVIERAASREAGEARATLAGDSAALGNAVERARQAARTDMDILIEAESGTGKELLARFIHQASPRRNRPFVAVNCAAFPETLLESELFGHARGAFTGAAAAKAGKFELADGGTLLLDEIGEMPLPLQPKLLRVLQEREVDRLGDTRPLRVDVRVIATTNRRLAKSVEQGQFRADLYYRLNVVPITVPPLRQRPGDIRPLIRHFLQKHAASTRLEPPQFSGDLLDRLDQYPWPGNVRELENFVRRAVALCPGETVGPELFEEAAASRIVDSQKTEDSTAVREDVSTFTSGSPIPGKSLRELERELLESTLVAEGGNRTRAARALGICPRTMRNKIREYGLPPRRYA
jgi:DNA-binding NtrC family response regulator